MVATTAGTAGDDNQVEYSEQKIERKSEIKEAKDGGRRMGKLKRKS
jgi:hypothetical protein